MLYFEALSSTSLTFWLVLCRDWLPNSLRSTPSSHYFLNLQNWWLRLMNIQRHVVNMNGRISPPCLPSIIAQYIENIAEGTTDPSHWVLWLNQHLLSIQGRSFDNLWNLDQTYQISFVCQRARNIHVTILTDPIYSWEKSM